MATTSTVLPRAQWQQRRLAHEQRVAPWIGPRLQRRREGARHPVDDFLFEYYTLSPAQLLRWQPGPGVALEGPVEHLRQAAGFRHAGDIVEVDATAVQRQADLLPDIERLLRSTAQRRPRIGCSALHEWAMVYRLPQHEVRHAAWPLRLAPEEIAGVVEQVGLRCTHFDAYRFFTEDALPRNERQLSRATQAEMEQPGCLHATMDLYKWSYRLRPLVGSELIADAFELARTARTLDMRAAPYDLRRLGVAPIPMQTPAGRAEFAALQRDLAEQGAALRSRLIDALDLARRWLDDQRSS